MNKVISNKIVLLMTILLWFDAGYAQRSTKDFLARYDLSYTVINPDTAPTDGVYSWWTAASKEDWSNYDNEPMVDEWIKRPEPLGFRGKNYQRFYIHFDTVYKVSPTVYKLEARSRCKNEYCNIIGSIVIDSVKSYVDTMLFSGFDNLTEEGFIYAHYDMDAYIENKQVARLFGRSYYWYLVHNDSVYYNALMIVADGYDNNQYTGKWVNLASDDTLTCNWGDFRIPESQEELDFGCGQFGPNKKYYDYGWKSYIDFGESWGQDAAKRQYYKEQFLNDENWWKKKK